MTKMVRSTGWALHRPGRCTGRGHDCDSGNPKQDQGLAQAVRRLASASKGSEHVVGITPLRCNIAEGNRREEYKSTERAHVG